MKTRGLLLFVREKVRKQATLIRHVARRVWQMKADLGNQHILPQEIATTNLRPDRVLWSETQRFVNVCRKKLVACFMELSGMIQYKWPMRGKSVDTQSH